MRRPSREAHAGVLGQVLARLPERQRRRLWKTAKDLSNEYGIPNHRPDPNLPAVDNHHTITGSTTEGKLKADLGTCKDWTTTEVSEAAGHPSAGFSWPREGVSGGTSGQHWMSTWSPPSCAAGIEITYTNGGGNHIGTGGGYGAVYCFAINP